MSWSKEQVDEFLTSEVRVGRLATVSGDGEPRVAPVWFRHDDDRLLVHSMEESSKVKNALATGRFSMTVDKDDAPYAGVILPARPTSWAATRWTTRRSSTSWRSATSARRWVARWAR